MTWLVLLIILFVVLALVAAKIKSHTQQSPNYPYKKNPVLFSPAERSFLGVLEQAIGADYRIFGKVRAADVVSVNSMTNRGAWRRAFNRIRAKHFDFVLCSKDDLAIVAAIELDDKSHQQRKRQERDDFLLGLCETVTLPLIRIPAQRTYSVQEIRSQVLSALGVKQVPFEVAPEPDEIADAQLPIKPEQEVISPSTSEPPSVEVEDPTCPKCSAPMMRRVAKTGANAGQQFWGCSAFPACRTVVPAKT